MADTEIQQHIPVLLEEVLSFFAPKPGQRYIDATVNGGGHAMAILEKVTPAGKVLGIELDPEIYARLTEKIAAMGLEDRFVAANESYRNLADCAREHGFDDADGVLFDLGISSWHVDMAKRGFTFKGDQVLDMRFNPEKQKLTAAQLVNSYPELEIKEILQEYGEERFAPAIAAAIVEHRKRLRITGTAELVAIIESAVPAWYRHRKINCATKTFQALRIAVNGELDGIPEGLDQAVSVLARGGKLCVISFHSLEDRIVKNFFKEKALAGEIAIITKKPVVAELAERKANPRARSAKLRVVEKL